MRVFGLDVGTTSVGFAVIDYDEQRADTGEILDLGVRIFTESREPKKDRHPPLNQARREQRLARRQIRRRRVRRRALNRLLSDHGLLPEFDQSDGSLWAKLMCKNAQGETPWDLRRCGLTERLDPYELGRALYHLAQRRHFRGRDLDEVADDSGEQKKTPDGDDDDKKAKTDRETLLEALRREDKTLGAYLADFNLDDKGQMRRKRGHSANREVVEKEFKRLWEAQTGYHEDILTEALRAELHDTIFHQRPVFWRTNTLRICPFFPRKQVCAKGTWLSAQRRMLEKLNNVKVASEDQRSLNVDERSAILKQLQTQNSMKWGAVRKVLKALHHSRGKDIDSSSIQFNFEQHGQRGEKSLMGNPVEAALAKVFGESWMDHPLRDEIRREVPDRLWHTNYREIGERLDGIEGPQRIEIRRADERTRELSKAKESFIKELDVTCSQATKLCDLKFPSGWDRYSKDAIEMLLPELERGTRLGALLNSPEYVQWRTETFREADEPTGEVLDFLPTPTLANPEELRRIAQLRNPTVVRTNNEVRKVVNKLLRKFGRPDRIRVELAREVGLSARERADMEDGMARHRKAREAAAESLKEKLPSEPSDADIEKWRLWKECNEICPYTGKSIDFNALFSNNEFEVEHIWPRSRSFDNSFKNKTLCCRKANSKKRNQTPYEAFGQSAEWDDMCHRMKGLLDKKTGITRGKVNRFVSTRPIDDDFTARQLVDTSYAARQVFAQLKRLRADRGPKATVPVDPVAGRATAHLRRLWGLNKLLSDDGEKNRADHRHHAVDALVIACTSPSLTNRLSSYFEAKDDPQQVKRPKFPPPWQAIRTDAIQAVKDIVVSHRVSKKVSGPLHEGSNYGDTGIDKKGSKKMLLRKYVTTKKVEELSMSELKSDPDLDGEGICDATVRKKVQDWVYTHVGKDGKPKHAFKDGKYPRICNKKSGEPGNEIRKVRLVIKKQPSVMTKTKAGYAKLGKNHHMAIYVEPGSNRVAFDVVSLMEASKRLRRHEPVINRHSNKGDFLFALATGETVCVPEGKHAGYWVVISVWTEGRAEVKSLTDAAHASQRTFSASKLVKLNAKKVRVDPIGQISPAND